MHIAVLLRSDVFRHCQARPTRRASSARRRACWCASCKASSSCCHNSETALPSWRAVGSRLVDSAGRGQFQLATSDPCGLLQLAASEPCGINSATACRKAHQPHTQQQKQHQNLIIIIIIIIPLPYGSNVAAERRFAYRTPAVEMFVLDTADFRRNPLAVTR